MKVYLDQANIVCSLGSSLSEVWKNLCLKKTGIISLKEKNLIPKSFTVDAGAPYQHIFLPPVNENSISEEYKVLIETLVNGLKPNEQPVDAIVIASNVNNSEKYLSKKNITEDICVEMLKDSLIRKAFKISPDLEVISIYNTCVSGLSALNIGSGFVKYLNKKQVIVITLEPRLGMWALMPLEFLNMLSRQPITARASVPFSIDRGGFVKGDGCAIAILSPLRKDNQVEIVAVAEKNDLYRLTDPHEEGRGLEAAIRDVLAQAQINSDEIDYVSAHATSTKKYDIVEADVLKKIFDSNKKIKITALKSQIGHTNISSGLIASIIAAKSVQEKTVTPVVGLNLDPEIARLNYVTDVKNENIKNALVNASGIGGYNASLLLRTNDQ
ncbi:MAG: hypothetical protein WC635_06945 [Bacteriovorax sp.]|jgi:3-oxoacyl-(acyl-carrier-protein) synthase